MKTDKEITLEFKEKCGMLSPAEEKEIEDKLSKKSIKEGQKGAAELKERFDVNE